MEKNFWKKYRMLIVSLLYTAVLLNYLSVERIISTQTFIPFAKKYRMLIVSLLYTAVLLNYLSVERIISTQTFIPFAVFCALFVVSRFIASSVRRPLFRLRFSVRCSLSAASFPPAGGAVCGISAG